MLATGPFHLNPEHEARNLETLIEHAQKLIVREGLGSLYNAINKLDASDANNWSVLINEADAVEFEVAQRQDLIVDFSGRISGRGNSWPLKEYRITVRVWTDKPEWKFREHLDCSRLAYELRGDDKRRLLLRLRFDHHPFGGDPSQDVHPWFHVHYGGKPNLLHGPGSPRARDGFQWYPRTIRAPRLMTPPMSFFLVTRWIIATYHPMEYREIIRSLPWKKTVAETEKIMWSKYFTHCGAWIQGTGSLVDESMFDQTSMESTTRKP